MPLTTVSPGVMDTQATATWRNRIINGDMRIDQRNNGASVTLTSGITSASFAVDRWRACRGTSSTATAQRSTVAPAGFTNSYLYTVGTGAAPAAADFSSIQQLIEGFNIADFGWGSAGAQSVTISFWVRSSLTGTFGLVVTNSAQTLAYATTYTISAANTFEFKTITIPGPTSATWLTDNGTGLQLVFDMGVGSNQSVAASTSWQSGNFLGVTGVTKPLATAGATFYITGVQFEAGTAATAFERRDYGRELIMCQRYFQFWKSGWGGVSGGSGYQYSDGVNFCVPTRVAPTIALTSWSTGARFPQANWFTANVGVEGFLSLATATSAGGNDNWLATGTASAEL